MAALAVEFWKLVRTMERTVERLPLEHQSKTLAQTKFASQRLETILRDQGLSLSTFDGKPFEPNLPVAAINGDEFNSEDELVIEATIEPTVTEGMQVLSMGKVILTKGAN